MNDRTEYHEHPWMGVFPATLCAFHEDEGIDEDGLRAYFAWLCKVPGQRVLPFPMRRSRMRTIFWMVSNIAMVRCMPISTTILLRPL